MKKIRLLGLLIVLNFFMLTILNAQLPIKTYPPSPPSFSFPTAPSLTTFGVCPKKQRTITPTLNSVSGYVPNQLINGVTTVKNNSEGVFGDITALAVDQTIDPATGANTLTTGTIYVTDDINNNVKVFTPTATGSYTFTTIPATFPEPEGIVVDKDGNIYVACNGNGAKPCIKKIIKPSPTSNVSINYWAITTFSTQDFPFIYLQNMAINGTTQELYVVDNGTKIYKVSTTGVPTLFAGSDESVQKDDNTTALSAKFANITGITVDPSSTPAYIYVTDLQMVPAPTINSVRRISISSPVNGGSTAGNVTTIISSSSKFTSPTTNILPPTYTIKTLSGITTDGAKLFFTDNTYNLVYYSGLDGSDIGIFAGSLGGLEQSIDNNQPRGAAFAGPAGIVFDNYNGRLFLMDQNFISSQVATSSPAIRQLNVWGYSCISTVGIDNIKFINAAISTPVVDGSLTFTPGLNIDNIQPDYKYLIAGLPSPGLTYRYNVTATNGYGSSVAMATFTITTDQADNFKPTPTITLPTGNACGSATLNASINDADNFLTPLKYYWDGSTTGSYSSSKTYTTTSNYSVKIISNNGCTAQAAVTEPPAPIPSIIVYPVPAKPIATSQTENCALVFTASQGGSGVKYDWLVSSAANTYSPQSSSVITPNSNDTYTLTNTGTTSFSTADLYSVSVRSALTTTNGTSSVTCYSGYYGPTTLAGIFPTPSAGTIQGPPFAGTNLNVQMTDDVPNGVWGVSNDNNSTATIDKTTGMVATGSATTGAVTISYKVTSIKGCSSTATYSLSILPPPTIYSFDPPGVCSNTHAPTIFTIFGKGFGTTNLPNGNVVAIKIGSKPITSFTVVSDNKITFTIADYNLTQDAISVQTFSGIAYSNKLLDITNNYNSVAYVPNYYSDNISVVSNLLTTPSTVNIITVGKFPKCVAVSPDGKKAYVSSFGSGNIGGNISIIDTKTNTLLPDPNNTSNPLLISDGTIQKPFNPNGIAVSSDRVYVAMNRSSIIKVINTATNTIIGGIDTKASSNPDIRAVCISPDGSKLFASNFNGQLFIITNLNSQNPTVKSLSVNSAGAICFSPDGTRAYVTNLNNSTVTVIDAVADEILKSGQLPVTIPVGSFPSGVSVSPDGTLLYVTCLNNTIPISIFNTSTNLVQNFSNNTIPSGNLGVSFTSDGTRAFVLNYSNTGIMRGINVDNTSSISSTPTSFGSISSNSPGNYGNNFIANVPTACPPNLGTPTTTQRVANPKTNSATETSVSKENWGVYPNPSNGVVKVNLSLQQNKQVQFMLTATNGKALYQQKISANTGNSTVVLNFNQRAKLAAGTYYLKAVGVDGGVTVKKVIIK